MAQIQKKQSPFSPKKIRRSIKLDRVQAADLRTFDIVYSCERCSFYAPDNNECMMGMPTEPHLEAEQRTRFNITGHMAFCRFLEID